MDLSIAIMAQIAVLSLVSATTVLALGVRRAPASAKSSYVRKGIGER